MADAADPLWAVLSPPRAERFRARAALAPDESLQADFSGWSKLVFLTADRALLFPRHHGHVDALRRELEALAVVAAAGSEKIPRVLEIWDDPDLSPYPIAAISRLPGTVLEGLLPELPVDTLAELARELGALAARWHDLAPGAIARRPPRALPHRVGLADLLGTSAAAPDAETLASTIVERLGLSSSAQQRVATAITRIRALAPVLAHSDLHEAQLLVEPGSGCALTGVLDWQTAVVDHPFTEFDLGEWGPTIWRRHRSAFPRFRRAYWNAYAAQRGLAEDLGPAFEWTWSVSHALRMHEPEAAKSDPDILGTPAEALAAVRNATAALP